MKEFDTLEELFKDLETRIEAGREAAKGHPIKVANLRHGDHFAYVHPIYGTPIFGKVIEKTEYPEDTSSIAVARENGFVFARCYSAICPEGELGDTHITRITHKIPKEIFDRAQANGFRHLEISN